MAISNFKFSKNGDEIIWKIPIINNGIHTDNEVIVIDTLPMGVKFIKAVLPKGTGTYNQLTREFTWNVGVLETNASYTGYIYTKVIDVTQTELLSDGESMGFINSIIISGSNEDDNTVNNTWTEEVAISTCPPTGGAIDDDFACLCGNVASNDTPCDKGISEWRLDEDSLTNVVVNYWDTSTGKYNFSYVSPTSEITATYELWCVVGDSEYYINSATITIPPLYTSDVMGYSLRKGINCSVELIREDGESMGIVSIPELINNCELSQGVEDIYLGYRKVGVPVGYDLNTNGTITCEGDSVKTYEVSVNSYNGTLSIVGSNATITPSATGVGYVEYLIKCGDILVETVRINFTGTTSDFVDISATIYQESCEQCDAYNRINDIVQLTFKAENLGTITSGVESFSILIPPGLSYVSHIGSGYNVLTGEWTIGAIANNSFTELKINVTATSPGMYNVSMNKNPSVEDTNATNDYDLVTVKFV